MLRSNEELREAICAWAAAMYLNLELVATMAFRMLDKRSTRARAGVRDPVADAASPSGGSSLLANLFAVPEDDTWAEAGEAKAAVGGRWLGDGRNPSTDSSASTTSCAGNHGLLLMRSRSL